jgi:hypothetical protein
MQLRALFRSPESDPPVDTLEAEYANWRKETEAVAKSYESWGRASRDDRWLAYASYMAALDREERAAAAYGRLAGQAETG